MADIYAKPGHLIRRLQQIAVAIFHTEVAKLGHDLTPVQYAALATVETHDGIDQATLAGQIAYDRATITGVIDRLVQKDLVVRRVSERDRRARELHITETGRRTLGKITPAVDAAQRIILEGLAPEEAEEFMRLLNKLTSSANDLSRAPLKSTNKT